MKTTTNARDFIILFVLLGVVGEVRAEKPARFVDAPALTDSVAAEVKDCPSAPGVVQVPLITWGGDIATIFANGNAAATASGSPFDQAGIKAKLVREDVFATQLKDYLACRSPFLRGTMGMMQMAAEAAARDPRTKLNVIYQLTWSAGGDALVVKEGVRKPRDLKGKTVAVQAYGPHVEYLARVLKDSGLTIKDVNIKWTKDLTGTGDSTPMASLHLPEVDAAMVIIPDALALTSRGKVGTGAEDSVKGARILLSTKTASRVIGDVYAVRSDFLAGNRPLVEKFVRTLLQAQERLATVVKNKATQGAEHSKAFTASAQLLLDSPQAVADVEGMYADAQFAGWKGNVSFFTDPKFPRGFGVVSADVQLAMQQLGMNKKKVALEAVKWSYDALKKGLQQADAAEAPRFDEKKVAPMVSSKAQAGQLGEGELFAFEVLFKPNQNSFPPDDYKEPFTQAINLATTYGGALITIEGHSDPLRFLKMKKAGNNPEAVLTRIAQSAKNLSLSRSNAVRDGLLQYAKKRGVRIDPSQFVIVGHGISKPKSGMCGQDPCEPKTEQEWLSNMRVEFRIIQVEAEQSVFNKND